MHTTRILTATLALSLVTLAGCGTSSVLDGSPPPTTSAPDDVPTTPAPPVDTPDTVAPPTAPPTNPTPPPTAPPPTTPSEPSTPSEPTTPPPFPTVDVTIDDGSFGSVDEMADTAPRIVVGEVVGVTSLGRPFLDRDPNAEEFVAVTVRVTETLKGEPTDEIVLSWQAFAVDADGERTATVVTNGLRPPALADRLVLFLDDVDPAWADVLGDVPTHQLVKLDGIAFLDGDRVVATEVGSPAAEQLVTMTLAEIRSASAS